MDLSVIDCFVKVADAKSISSASRLHRLPKSTLSHRIRQLEDQFGVELFVREGHQLNLTDAGSELLRYARKIQTSCDDAAMAMADMHQGVAERCGSARPVSLVPPSPPSFYAFQETYPQVMLDVVFLSARQPFSDVSDLALDGIFHWGEPSDVDYVSRRLATASYGLYASADYLAQRGQPASADDLARHRGLIFRNTTRLQPWHLSRQGTEETEILLPASLVANDYWTLKYFAVAGQGIAYLPGFFVETECQSDLLLPVMPEWRSRETAINLIYSRRRHVSRRFKAFVGFCLEFYRHRERHQSPRYFVEKILR